MGSRRRIAGKPLDRSQQAIRSRGGLRHPVEVGQKKGKFTEISWLELAFRLCAFQTQERLEVFRIAEFLILTRFPENTVHNPLRVEQLFENEMQLYRVDSELRLDLIRS